MRRLEGQMDYITRTIFEGEENFLKKTAVSGLTARQMHHLDAIAALGNPTPSEIAAAQELTKPSVTALIGRLSSAGFIRKSKSDSDRREYHVHVTPKGMGFVAEHRAVHRRLARIFISALSPKEVEILEALITKVIAAGERRAGRPAARRRPMP
jgi:DNA-binding MarR family transcriptional regulator